MNFNGKMVIATEPKVSNGFSECRGYFRTVRPGQPVNTNIRLSAKDSCGLALATVKPGTLIEVKRGYFWMERFEKDGQQIPFLKGRIQEFAVLAEPDPNRVSAQTSEASEAVATETADEQSAEQATDAAAGAEIQF